MPDFDRKYPNLFQILSAFAAHDDLEDDAIIRKHFAKSTATRALLAGAAKELGALKSKPATAAKTIGQAANRNFARGGQALVWVNRILAQIAGKMG